MTSNDPYSDIPEPEPLLPEESEKPPVKDVNGNLLNKFYEYLATAGQSPQRTKETYTYGLTKFNAWCLGHNLSFFDVTRKEMRAFQTFLFDNHLRPNSVRTILQSIKVMYYYMIDELECIDKCPLPHKIKVKRFSGEATYTPDAKELIQMRLRITDSLRSYVRTKRLHLKRIKIVLAKATLFELILSTGMSISEARYIRISDLNFKGRVRDEITNYESEFIRGSIFLDPAQIRVKKRTKRTVFLTPLCVKLLRTHIKHSFGLTLAENQNSECNLPMFPWNTRQLRRWIEEVGQPVLGDKKVEKINDKFYRDINLSKLDDPKTAENVNLPTKMKNILKRNQERARKEGQYADRVDNETNYRKRRIILFPHAIRHVHACVMFHRDWRGHRKDFLYIRDLMGHKSKEMTLEYMVRSGVVRDDREWRQLFLADARAYWILFNILEQIG